MPDACCNHNCNQGRACPVRQACELPEPDPAPRELIFDRTGLTIAAIVALAWTIAGIASVWPFHS